MTQFHFTTWPEHGHPTSTASIIELIDYIDESTNELWEQGYYCCLQVSNGGERERGREEEGGREREGGRGERGGRGEGGRKGREGGREGGGREGGRDGRREGWRGKMEQDRLVKLSLIKGLFLKKVLNVNEMV